MKIYMHRKSLQEIKAIIALNTSSAIRSKRVASHTIVLAVAAAVIINLLTG